MTPKVSILVPVYNVSPFIERCAKSLFNQTLTDIEYIFVDDASPDDSIEILLQVIQQFPHRQNQVKIIHHPTNLGLAATRNTALNAATGHYISVVDSDDYIEVNMVELLYNKAIDENADLVIADYYLEFETYSKPIFEQLSNSKSEYIKDILTNEIIHSTLWNKLINRELYSYFECRVPSGMNYCEDRHTVIRLFYFAKKIVKIDQAFYHYVQYNNQAITKNKGQKHFENIILFWELTDEFLKEKNLYASVAQIIDNQKVKSKVRLLLDTPFPHLRKKYVSLFYDEETRCLHNFKRGEKLMLMLVRYRLFLLANWLYKFSVYKNKLYNR